MAPITFTCEAALPSAPEDIARQILDLTKWPDFHGYGPIPGFKAAAFEVQTPGVVGTRIRVTNREGSSHVEEIVEWQPDQQVRLEMKEFSPPLSRLASGFEETWALQRTENGAHVTRWLMAPSRFAAPVSLPVTIGEVGKDEAEDFAGSVGQHAVELAGEVRVHQRKGTSLGGLVRNRLPLPANPLSGFRVPPPETNRIVNPLRQRVGWRCYRSPPGIAVALALLERRSSRPPHGASNPFGT
jgi:hypothetical protein